MNLSRSFSFGTVIKTFLPGLVVLAAIVMVARVVTDLGLLSSSIWDFVARHEQAALVIAVPSAALLGLISNILVFMGLNDALVRTPVRKRNVKLFELFDLVEDQIRKNYWKHVACTKTAVREEFLKAADVELIMLPEIGVEKISYVRQQYWYHLEFQVNLILSATLFFLALIALMFVSCQDCSNVGGLGILIVLAYAVFLIFMTKAARKNYHRHICKMLSLMTSFLCSMDQPAPRPARSAR